MTSLLLLNWRVWAVASIAIFLTGTHWKAYNVGKTQERAAWRARESTEVAAANAKILQLETDARASERAHGEVQHLISVSLQKDLQNAETQRQADVVAARDGALRLRDSRARTESACTGGLSAPTARAGGRDGAAGTELSPELTEFLISEANRADSTVLQLTACQKVVADDRADTPK